MKHFPYYAIQRLVRVTDTEGNVTTSTYNMGDRRTEVNHPASGITSFTYDALGNMLTKQTANLAKEGKLISYDYDYQRLTGINYPDHTENNVKYYYGGRNASQNRIGRLMLREDGTGAIEYFYGKMGEVTKTRRTMIVPNQAIATYVTQWTYDSHNRLLEMIYPDEEKITYSYNLGGQLEKVHGYKSYGYDYVSKIGYDKFEQRTYLKYCNGAEIYYTYEPQRRRLQNLTVNSAGNTIMDNANSKFMESNPSDGNTAYNKNRKPYSILRHNCGTFAADVINQDESVDAPRIINPTPVNIVDEYQEEGNAAVKHDPNNNKTTIGKGDESDAKKN